MNRLFMFGRYTRGRSGPDVPVPAGHWQCREELWTECGKTSEHSEGCHHASDKNVSAVRGRDQKFMVRFNICIYIIIPVKIFPYYYLFHDLCLKIFYFIIRNGIGQKLYNIMIALSLAIYNSW